MSAKEKEAAAKQTFTFLALINEQNVLRSRMESAKHGFCESVKKDMQKFQKKRKRLRSRHLLFLRSLTSKTSCEAGWEVRSTGLRVSIKRHAGILKEKEAAAKHGFCELVKRYAEISKEIYKSVLQ